MRPQFLSSAPKARSSDFVAETRGTSSDYLNPIILRDGLEVMVLTSLDLFESGNEKSGLLTFNDLVENLILKKFLAMNQESKAKVTTKIFLIDIAAHQV